MDDGLLRKFKHLYASDVVANVLIQLLHLKVIFFFVIDCSKEFRDPENYMVNDIKKCIINVILIASKSYKNLIQLKSKTNINQD